MTATMPSTQAPAAAAVAAWLAKFEEVLTAGDPAGVAALFAADCYWRDLIAFTWNIRTFEGRAPAAAAAGRLAGHRRGGTRGGRRRGRGVDRLRDRRRPRPRSPAAARRPVLDAADHSRRAQGLRGAQRAQPPQGHGARGQPGAHHLAGSPRAGGVRAGPRRAAVRADRRRR